MRDPKTARELAGISQFDLAIKAQVSLSTVCRAERFGQYPRNALVKSRYLAALGPMALLPQECSNATQAPQNPV